MGAGTYNKMYNVQCQSTYIRTGQTGTYTRRVGSVRSSSAIRRRRRPKPLGVTDATWTTRTISTDIMTVEYGAWRRTGTVDFCYPSVLPKYVEESTEDNVSTAVDRATRAFAANHGAGISVIEMPSTVRMIGRRAKTFYDVIRLSGKGDFRGVQRAMKRATGYNISSKTVDHLSRKYGSGRFSLARASAAWLEYNFGWKTFFQSLYDSVQQLVESEQVYRRSSRYKGARAGFVADITNRRQFNLNRLGLVNPLEIAWDAVRLSFVIDWFLPIAPILRSFSAGRGLGHIYGYRSHTRTKTTYINSYVYKTVEWYTRRRINYSVLNLRLSSPSGLWKTITSLALLQGLR